MSEVRAFDQNREYAVQWRRLPHWSQAGVPCFITFRTADSMPGSVLATWEQQRDDLLIEHGLTHASDWRAELRQRPRSDRDRIWWQMTEKWDQHLDGGHGACVLRQPELSQIVLSSLQHFDGDRYVLTDAVVMPNHVHLLAAFPDEDKLLAQCESWKRWPCGSTGHSDALENSGSATRSTIWSVVPSGLSTTVDTSPTIHAARLCTPEKAGTTRRTCRVCKRNRAQVRLRVGEDLRDSPLDEVELRRDDAASPEGRLRWSHLARTPRGRRESLCSPAGPRLRRAVSPGGPHLRGDAH